MDFFDWVEASLKPRDSPPSPENARPLPRTATFPLLDLPPSLMHFVVSKLSPRITPMHSARDVPEVAGACTTLLQAVLEAHPRVTGFLVAPVLAPCFARLTFAQGGSQPSRAILCCRLLPGGPQTARWTVSLPLRAAALACADSADATGIRLLSPAAAATVTTLRWIGGTPRLPPHMHALQQVDVSHAVVWRVPRPDSEGNPPESDFAPDWLPPSSAGMLRELLATSSSLERVPEGLQALHVVQVSGCHLASDWLPPSSSGVLRELLAASSSLERVPEALPALETVVIDRCRLASDWLPSSSASRVRSVSARETGLQCLPPGMAALEEVDIDACEGVSEDWLPLSSRAALRRLSARSSNLTRVPEGLGALTTLDLWHCRALRPDGVPASSTAHLQLLNLAGSCVTRLPDNMAALASLDVSECTELAADALPAGSCARLQDLVAAESSLVQLPEGMAVLTHIDVRECDYLAKGWLPESSGGAVTNIDAASASLGTLPPNMGALYSLDVTGAGLDAKWLPHSSAQRLAKLEHGDGMGLPRGAEFLAYM